MKALILSSLGSGGSFWELVLPIWIVVAIFYVIDFLIRFIKRKRIELREKMINDLTTPVNNTNQNHIDSID